MRRFLLPLILLLAFLFRIVSVTQYPVGFNADEASFGYDAYSILHTGRDQWGRFMPLVLKSFGDYKSPLYAYLTIPSVEIFGLTKLAVRLPNVILGTLAIFAVFLLSNELVKKKFGLWNLPFGIFPAFLLSLNPWAVMMSRGAFEANLITLFLPLGVYFFLKATNSSKYLKYYTLASLSFGLSLFSYHSAKLITPIVIVGLIIIFWKKIRVLDIRKIIIPVLIISIFAFLTIYTFSIGGGSRISERSITQGALEEGAKAKIQLIQNGANPKLAKFFHNKYQVVAQRFVLNYFQYFSGKFLVTQGSSDSYYGMFPGIGVIYLFETFLLFGLVPYFLMKNEKTTVLLIVLWLLVAPLPAALSTGAGYSGNRAEGMIPILQILESFGFIGWVTILNRYNHIFLKVFSILLGIAIILNVENFVKSYIQKIPQSSYTQMLDGNLEAARWINQNESGKDVIISRSFSEPQIFFAFANIWNPSSYQDDTKSWDLVGSQVSWVDQLPEYKLGNYTIKSVDWKKDIKKGVVIVGRPDDFPASYIPDMIFYYSNGQPSLYVKNY
ncbi:MAG TPA: glycosyltransferase family 39 protein [Patescibacteria group bacterium]|nr:glycosyltransferase family 39 protein [Patescibacteria group bacterium]